MSQTRTVDFTEMKHGTKKEYELLHELEKPFLALTADRVLSELRRQGEATLEGYKITRLEHALQSATRAQREGAAARGVRRAEELAVLCGPRHAV